MRRVWSVWPDTDPLAREGAGITRRQTVATSSSLTDSDHHSCLSWEKLAIRFTEAGVSRKGAEKATLTSHPAGLSVNDSLAENTCAAGEFFLPGKVLIRGLWAAD